MENIDEEENIEEEEEEKGEEEEFKDEYLKKGLRVGKRNRRMKVESNIRRKFFKGEGKGKVSTYIHYFCVFILYNLFA